MSIWMAWIALGILFIIMEMFFLTLDFLAVGVAAILTGVIVNFSGGYFDSIERTSFIFAFLALISLFISRTFFFPKMVARNKTAEVNFDKIIGEKVLVQIVDGDSVTYYEGNYWSLSSADLLSQGDTAEVTEIKGNKLIVKKLF